MMEENKDAEKKNSASSNQSGPQRSGKKAQRSSKTVWRYIWTFRAVIISLPVLIFAIVQAFRNAILLPETVGLNLQASGEFATLVPRPTAVVVPLLVTMGCVLLTCFTKRPLFPWLISLFSLVIPVMIWVINLYPA